MARTLRLIALVVVLVSASCFGAGAAIARETGQAAATDARIAEKREQVRVGTRASRSALLGQRAVRYARRLLGVPYRYGGESPRTGFDCSGLVRHVFARVGVNLPHSSYADFGVGRSVPRGTLRPGDLVFFGGLGHVGLYVGAGRFIHAPRSGTTVRITSLSDPWYASRYDGARRVVGAGVRAHPRR